MADLSDRLAAAVELLKGAQYAVALTGAGVSTPSGIPDFRSPDSGLWSQIDPLEVASLVGFRLNPERFYSWIRPLAHLLFEAVPNPAHIALARLEELGVIRALITQNIDMLHSRAGSHTIFELHGHLREATCVECFHLYALQDIIRDFVTTGQPPRCPACDGLLKPNVILYGEQLPFQVFQGALQAARQADVMLVVGSSLTVAPAADIPAASLVRGGRLIIINYEPTYLDDEAQVVIREDVAEVLPRLVALLEGGERP
jgi:NAD-dependent deacetylase